MDKLILVTIFLLSVSLTATAGEKKTADQYWKETGLSLLDLKSLISTKNCYTNSDSFRGCINALNALGSRDKATSKILPNLILNDSLFPLSLVNKNFGQFSEVSFSEPKEKSEKQSMLLIWKKESEKRTHYNNALNQIFNETKMTPVSFEDLLTYKANKSLVSPDTNAAVIATAMNAYITEAIDPHAHFDAAEEVSETSNNSSTSIIGVGLNLQEVGGKIVVVSPVENGPAFKSGIKANDIITQVNNMKAQGLNLKTVVENILGKEGSSVILYVERNVKSNKVNLSFTIVRKKIIFENVTSKILTESDGQKIGLIKLRNFMDFNACKAIAQKLKDFTNQQVNGLILDLRGNGGGYLDQAVCIGGLFVGKQVIVKVKDLNADKFSDYESKEESITDLPLTVLVDSGSASASEILAGALRDYERAWIVGERSFGKGSVQAPFKTPNPKINVYRTIQRFYQPAGNTNQIEGILPSFEAPLKLGATADERFALREADIFPNALKAVGYPWIETRSDEIAIIKDCINKTGEAATLYTDAEKNSNSADYQQLYAEDVLKCAR